MMKKTNENELDKLFSDVICIAGVKAIEHIGYSLTHPTWFDKLLIKTLNGIEKFTDMFFIIILRFLKDELEKS